MPLVIQRMNKPVMMNSVTLCTYALFYKTFTCICLICVVSIYGYSQLSNYSFDNVNGIAGISGISVSAITQDNEGFIWIGTVDGLKKFDGYTTTIFHHKIDDSTSLVDDEIITLCVDNNDNIWVGTVNGLSIYNKKENSFSSFNNTKEVDSSICGNVITGLTKDDHGNIWISSYDGGVCVGKKTKNGYLFQQSKELIKNNTTGLSNQLFAVDFDTNKNLWVASDNGLYFFSKDRKFQKKLTANTADKLALARNSVYKIFTAKDGSVWVSGKGMLDRITYREAGGNYNFSIKHYLPFIANINELTNWNINDFILDNNNNGWIATNDFGVIKFTLKADSIYNIERFENNETSTTSLASSLVNKLFQDKFGTIWIGTEKGVSKYLPSKKKFNESALLSGLQLNRDILAILYDKQERLWIGYDSDTVLIIAKEADKIKKTYLKLPGSSKNIIDQVNAIYQGANGSIYFATLQQGIFVFKNKSGSLNNGAGWQIINRKNNTALISNNVYCFTEDKENDLWIGTYKGLYKYNILTNRLSPVYISPSLKAMPGYSVSTIFIDEEDAVWCGTDDGLVILKSNKVQSIYKRIQNDSTSLNHNEINCIISDKQKNIWVATKAGLNRFDGKTRKFKRVNIAEELSQEQIKILHEDVAGNLWMGTYHGLLKFDTKQNKIYTYSLTDGLPSDQFHANSKAVDENGIIYFGTKKGIISFNTIKLQPATIIPPIVITNIKILNQDINTLADAAIINTYKKECTLKLNYNQNFISFEFAALNYINAQSNNYSYILEGIDKDWIQAGNKRFADYTDIKPGNYTFKVKAANSDGVWNETPATITVIIMAPWWQTWWFYLFCCVAAAAIIYTIYRIRINQLIKFYNLRSNIAKDLHDDVGSALSSISLLSNMAQQGKTTTHLQPEEIFSRIGDTSQKMIDLMDDIVWSVNPDNDRFSNMLIRMREYTAEMLEAKNINFDFVVDTNTNDLKIPMYMRKDYFLIYKEVINNLAKYSQAKNASIKIEHTAKNLKTTITDNGQGFDINKLSAGNGLNNIKKRVKDLHGTLSINSQISKGTCVTLSIAVP